MKIVSINIELGLHTDTVIPFFKKENADIVCFQEIFEDELVMYKEVLNKEYIFKPMANWDDVRFYKEDKKIRTSGIAIFANNIKSFDYKYIVGEENSIPFFKHSLDEKERNIINILVLWIKVLNNEKEYNIANTQLTWTANGTVQDFQLEDARKLIDILDTNLDNFILVGDTNAPRGRETFSLFTNKFKDNIPQEYKTTIDQNLHRKKGLQYVVDCFFTKGDIKVNNVELKDGISDHMAVIGEVE